MIALVAALWLLAWVVPLALGVPQALAAWVVGLWTWVVSAWAFRGEALRPTGLALLAFASLLVLVAVPVASQSVALGGAGTPYMAGSDGEGYYIQAVGVMHDWAGGRAVGTLGNYSGYQRLLAAVFVVTGPDLYVGVLVNVWALVTAAGLLGRSALLLGAPPRAVFWTVVLFLLTTRFSFYALVLLKEPFLVLGITLLLYAVAVEHSRRGNRFISYAGVATAIVIFGTMRMPLLPLLPIMALSLGWRVLTRGWRPVLVGVAVLAVLGGIFAQMTGREIAIEAFQRTIFDNNALDTALESSDPEAASGVVGSLMASFQTRPIWARLLTLPLAVGIQHVMPPNVWSTRFLTDHLAMFFGVNGNVVWLAFVGLTVVYAGVFWREIDPPAIRRLCVIGWGLILSIAFMYGGVIPRYASPYLLLIYPAAGLVVCELAERRARRRLRLVVPVAAVAGAVAVVAYALFLMVGRG